MKLSPAFSTLLHIIWSALFGLIISGGTAIIQYNSTHGINIEQDAMLFALVITTGIGSTTIAAMRAIQQSPALPVAKEEAKEDLAVVGRQLAQSAHTRIDQLSDWLQAHMQEHTVVIQKAATPSALSPVRLEPLPAQNTPVAPNTPPVDAVPLTTVPAMPVVQQ